MSTLPSLAVVLSAGMGRRLKSSLPKSLHPVAGRPILARILQSLKRVGLDNVRVVSRKEYDHLIRPVAKAFKAEVFFQPEGKKGTAKAVESADLRNVKGNVLIMNGDHPFLEVKDLKNIIQTFTAEKADLCLGVIHKEKPGDYGRIIRQKQKITAIVEKDSLSHESEKISEVNAGLYLVKADLLNKLLPQIDCQNSKEEYCFTDIVSLCVKEHKNITSCTVSENTAFGVNTQQELALAGRKVFSAKLNQLMSEGVIIIDPLSTYVEEAVQVGKGSVIYPGVYLKGRTVIGPFCAVEPHSFISDSLIHEFVLVRAGSYLEAVEVEASAQVGPYARLRPGVKIGKKAKVGNFVEMKKTHFGAGSKAGHFSYLGDTEVGENVNIGCGVVTANLDLNGKKNKTIIKNNVFVGSGAQLVAPVSLGEESAVGAGSVITQDVPKKTLALGRAEQKNKTDYFTKRKS